MKLNGHFTPFEQVQRYEGDDHYVPGSISLIVDGVEVFSLDLWDDINWLWPYLIRALEDYRVTGFGETYFPDQPILFKAERIRGELLRISVTVDQIDKRQAVLTESLLFPAMAKAAASFLVDLDRLCPRAQVDEMARSIVGRWVQNPR